jgi:SAM-dependent methyltransferase
MKPDYGDIARAFNKVAADYDAVYSSGGNAVMTWLRQESLVLLRDTFPPGGRLLEIGCGSGEEAVHLARDGYTIVATDISPAMVVQTQTKARAAGLADRVTAVALPSGHLDALRPVRRFEGAYASFGSLNCEPDLTLVRDALSRLLQPNTALVCSVIARWCPFEIAWFLLHGRPREGLRRLRRGWQQVPVGGRDGIEVLVSTRYLSVRDVARAFAPTFAVEKVMSLPLLLPPPYLDPFYRARRGIFDRVEHWERRLRSRWPWRTMGDHIALVLRRAGQGRDE